MVASQLEGRLNCLRNVIARVINSAYRKEPQAFIDRLRSFGIADSLGVDIQGEPRPTLPSSGNKKLVGNFTSVDVDRLRSATNTFTNPGFLQCSCE